MQIIDLVYDFDFMERFNISAPADTIMDDMFQLTQVKWFESYGMIPIWKIWNGVPLALIPTKHGLCFNFNMVDAEDLINFNE
jgi:hypothetical protein